MSRNGYTRFSSAMANGQLGTAYSPAAEGSAEGDILADVNPLSAEVGLEHGGESMGVSAYDIRGLRESDADMRLGTDPQYEAAIRGLREDDANLRIGGLREDDAGLRMGTAYAPDAEGAAEGDRAWPAGQQAVHYLSDADEELGVSAYDRLAAMQDEPRLTPLGVSAYDRLGRTGDAGSGVEGDAEGSAEGLRTQQLGGILVTNGRVGEVMGVSAYDRLGVSAYDAVMQGLREDDAGLRMGGLREDDAGLRMGGLREDDAGLRMGVSAYDRLQGLREQDTNLVLLSMAGLREDDAGLRMGEVRCAMMLRGLADAEDVVDEMGRRRAGFRKRMRRPGHKKFMKGTGERNVRDYDEMGVSAYDRLGAEDFHPRFDAVMIEGIGVMGNIFDDIFGRTMSYEEYIGKLRVIADQWGRIKPRLDRLPQSSQDSIRQNMKAAEASYENYTVTVPAYIAEGNPGFIAHSGRPERVKRWETYLPTVDKLVSQAEVLGTAYTPAQVNKDAIQNVQQRIDAAGTPTFVQQAAPYAAGAVGAGAIVGLILAVA